jgi:hypothetical protein
MFIRTRSEVDPIEQNEDGTISLHLVLTAGYQEICPIGVYHYDFRSNWKRWTSIIPEANEPYPFAAEDFMSDALRLPCEWIAKNRSIKIELTSKIEGDQRYINIDLLGFQGIRDPEGLVRFVINRMVHKAKIVLEFYRMRNNLE